jgi:branched-chain amino acid transport system ATP-binding protein
MLRNIMNEPDQQRALPLPGFQRAGGVTPCTRQSRRAGCERRALIGPNGAGKTTFFNLITVNCQQMKARSNCWIPISPENLSNRANLGWGEPTRFPSCSGTYRRRKPVSGGQCNKNWNSIHQTLAYYRNAGLGSSVAEQVGLADHLNDKVLRSHGCNASRVRDGDCHAPRLIMFDEPAAGLSPSERVILTHLIKGLPSDVTLILIEHDMEVVLDIADQITVLHRGAVLAEGSPSEIKKNHEVQNVYLGSSYA